MDKGPFAVKKWSSGKRLVARFYIAQYCGSRPSWISTPKRLARGVGPYESHWFVMDIDTGKVAVGTSKEGYEDKSEASKIAAQYRDEYGAYVEMDF